MYCIELINLIQMEKAKKKEKEREFEEWEKYSMLYTYTYIHFELRKASKGWICYTTIIHINTYNTTIYIADI